MTVLVINGEIVDPVKSVVHKADLLIEKGKVVDIFPADSYEEISSSIRIIDASHKLVVPGLIDMHVHLREPGQEYKETIETGGKAGLTGGFTGLACMPNTTPPNDCRSITEFILEQAKRAKLCKIYPIAAITKGQKGETLSEFGDLKKAGAVGLSDDGVPVKNSRIMRHALEYAAYHDLTVISHCEDTWLSNGGDMHEGEVSTRIGLAGIPAVAEEIMVYREIALSRLTGCPVHIAHVSTARSVALIRQAKEDALPVTAETAPHYFTLDHQAVTGYDTRTKMNPPLRTAEDVAAIKKGLAEGVIDAIATDHAPHSTLEKNLEFSEAAFGIIGLETALPLTLELVRQGILSLPEAVSKLSFNPARILGVSGGVLEKGSAADLAIIDPEMEYTLEEKDILSKSKNTPFLGKPLKGRNTLTMVNGKVVWKLSKASKR